MRIDLILTLHFSLITTITLNITPTHLLAVFELEEIFRNRTYGKWEVEIIW